MKLMALRFTESFVPKLISAQSILYVGQTGRCILLTVLQYFKLVLIMIQANSTNKNIANLQG